MFLNERSQRELLAEAGLEPMSFDYQGSGSSLARKSCGRSSLSVGGSIALATSGAQPMAGGGLSSQPDSDVPSVLPGHRH